MLDRLLAERRRRWEANQLATFASKAHAPSKNWKAKYKSPVAPDTGLPHLPDTWCWATVDQCSSIIQYGTSAKTSGDCRGVPVLRMGNIARDGRLILDHLKSLPSSHAEFPELLLAKGDLLFNRTNSAELVGKTAMYEGIPSPCSFASYLIRVRLLPDVSPAIVTYSLNSALGRAWVNAAANQTVGQANVNGSKLAAFAFPLPPLAEQGVIVEAVEDQLSVIDHVEAELDALLEGAQVLRQAVLSQAFSGNLVPHAPGDEPASELLKRIAAEREHRRPTGKPGRRQAL